MNPHVFNGRGSPAIHPKGSPKGQRICPIALGKKTYHQEDDKKLLKELDKFEYPSDYANKPIAYWDAKGEKHIFYPDDDPIDYKLDAKLEESLNNHHNDSLEIDWDNISKRKAKKLAKRGIYPPSSYQYRNNDNIPKAKPDRMPYHKNYKIKRNYQEDYSSKFLK